jgi:large subunit ribosomal protein L5
MNNLQKQYNEVLVQKLQKELGLANPMATPRLTKIVVNMGVMGAVADKKLMDKMSGSVAQLTGQKPRIAKAKKAIAGFKLRQGDPIGVVVTLRGRRMYDFFEKLVTIVLPRIKDFRGVRKTNFDGRGNYALGLHEYSVFPEIDPASVDRLQGMEIIIVTSSRTNDEGVALLTTLGMPFVKEGTR